MTILKNKWLQLLLIPVSMLYSLVMILRNFCYDHQFIMKSTRIQGCKIISIGNISVGGTGKTPTVEYLAALLLAQNKKPAILSRGYRRKSRGLQVVSDGETIISDCERSGDEPYLLARNLPGTPVVVEGDRIKGAKFIVENFSPDYIILDDGFQHRRIQRDLDIVLIDASQDIGNGLTIPGGWLREPLSGLRRADIIILTRVDQSHDPGRLAGWLRTYLGVATIQSIHQPVCLKSLSSLETVDIDLLAAERVIIFSGIGNPQSFRSTVTALGAIITDEIFFPDHHTYSSSDITNLTSRANQHDARWILTTEKDAIKLQHMSGLSTKFLFLKIVLKIVTDEDKIIEMLKL